MGEEGCKGRREGENTFQVGLRRKGDQRIVLNFTELASEFKSSFSANIRALKEGTLPDHELCSGNFSWV